MNPFDSIADHAYIADGDAILSGHVIDGHGLSINSHLTNQIFCQFAFPMLAALGRLASEMIKGVLFIFSLRKVFEIIPLVISLLAILVIYRHFRRFWPSERLHHDAVNLHSFRDAFMLKFESAISRPRLFLGKNHSSRIAQSPKIGNLIDTLIANYRKPMFMHVSIIHGLMVSR